MFFFSLKLQDGPCGSEKEFPKKHTYYDYPIEGVFCVLEHVFCRSLQNVDPSVDLDPHLIKQ